MYSTRRKPITAPWKLSLLALGFALAGVSQAKRFIIDGEVVKQGDELAKFTVMIANTDSDTNGWGRCSGTLIAPNVVLTAGHCVLSPEGRIVRDAAKILVMFNDFATERMDLNNASIAANQVIVDADYFDENGRVVNDGSQTYGLFNFRTDDIALIRLSRPAPEGFAPLQRFATRSEISDYARALYAAGYGKEGTAKDAPTGRLKVAQVDLESNNYFYSYIETSYRTGITNNGDSGGPLLVKHPTRGYLLAGVHSTGDSGPNPSAYGAEAVRVADYESFLRRNLTRMGVDPAAIYGRAPAPRSGSRWPSLTGN